MTNLRTLLTAYRALRSAQRSMVLATVVETLGSTYRKAGARMLITEDGGFHGIIGGGCFEGDLLERARIVFDTGKPSLLFYDMRAPEDELWGLGLGCNGAVRLLLQRLSEEQGFEPLETLERCLSRRGQGVLASVCASEHAAYPLGRHLFCGEGKTTSIDFPRGLVQGAGQVRQTQTPLFAECDAGNGSVTVFFDWIRPPPHVLVIGAGPDALPVVELARLMDWEITVVDHREAYADPQRFSRADRVLTAAPEALATQVKMDTVDAAVLMTHNIGYDERFLRALADTSIEYIGLLGPVARRERLRSKLGETARPLTHRIFGPVGLDIGAGLPEEIALSIIAEMVAHLNSRQGRSSRSQATPVDAATAVD